MFLAPVASENPARAHAPTCDRENIRPRTGAPPSSSGRRGRRGNIPLALVAAVLPAGALATPPVYIAFSGADALVPPQRRTEASRWVAVGANLGTTAGTEAAGAAGLSGSAPFELAALMTATAAATTLMTPEPRDTAQRPDRSLLP